MSKKSIALFIAACAEDPALDAELTAAERTTDAWVAVAKKAGFEFIPKELHGLVEDLRGCRLSAEEVIPSLLKSTTGQLSDRELASVGAGTGSDHSLGSWAKVEGLDVTWSSGQLNTLLSRYRESDS